MGVLKSTEQFKEEVKKRFDNIDVSEVNYVNNRTKCVFICSVHGRFEKTPKDILLKTSKGCPKCSIDSFKINFEDSLIRFNERHGGKFEYHKDSFLNYSTKMKITCSKHGDFFQTPSEHLKYGCEKCRNESYEKKNDYYLELFTKKYGDRFIYPENIENSKSTIDIVCRKHGKFNQRVSNHIKGIGCKECVIEKSRKDIKLHLRDFKLVHEGKFDYSSVDLYKKFKTIDKIDIHCSNHGFFSQKINSHKNGRGCPKCSNNGRPSKDENDLFEEIKILFPDTIQSYRGFKDVGEIDIYIPSLKIGLEYNGLYWHSDKFKADKNYHLNKTLKCEKEGINLIQIFEDEWLTKKDIVKSRLLSIFGKTQNRIWGRKCKIKNVESKEARLFLNENHIQGSLNSIVSLGLYFENELVSLMTFGNLRKNLGQNSKEGSYELLRFCNKLNTSVVGGASKLFKYFLKTYNPESVISYADRRWSQGSLYKQLGFEQIEKKITPNYFYLDSNFKTRQNRYKFRKDMLVKQGYSKDKTERQIMSEMGYSRIYDCGVLKFKI